MKSIFKLCTMSMGLFLFFQVNTAFAAEMPTPKEGLQRLLEGNERFVADKSLCPDRNQDRRAATVAQQRPFAVVLGCSDSRVPPELAFDQGIGDIFVVRVAGNVVGETELDSVEYSAIYNNSSIILVLGHENCGAVTAVMENKTHDIEAIAQLIKPALQNNTKNKKKTGPMTLTKAIEANIQNSVNRIKKSAPIAKLIQDGKVEVVGAYYDLNTGKVSLVQD